ncbi:hypothetical protein [Phocaeicola faecalis]
MAEIYNNRISVFANELIAYNPKRNIGSPTGFLSEGTYYTLVNRRHLVVLERARRNFSARIDYETMRRDIKQKYIAIYGDPMETIHGQGILEEYIPICEDIHSKLVLYRDEQGKSLKPQKIEEYTMNARVMKAVIALRDHKKMLAVGSSDIRFNVWDRLSERVNELLEVKGSNGKPKYPHNLPGNSKALRRKVETFEREGWQSLIHKGRGNKGAAKVEDEEMEAILYKLLSYHTNLNNVQIMEVYNQLAESMDKKTIKSPVTIDNYRKKFEAVTISLSKGTSAYKGRIEKQIHREPPKTAFTYWTLDGWTAELLYQKREEKMRRVDGELKRVMLTTYTSRMTIVVILDACCKYPIGYAIGEHESPALIREALRNAVKHGKELFGSRFKPVQMQSDNYQKGVMVPFYEAMTKYYTPAALKNAKSKIVEPYFKYLNVKYCQMQGNWSGFGITSDKDKQPNTDALNANHKLIPDEAGAIAQLEAIMKAERAAKIGAYRKAWDNTPDDRRLPFSDEEYLMLMGDTTGRTNHLAAGDLLIELQGEKLYFETLDAELRNHLNEDWVVRYDPEDMSQVLISNATATKAHRVKEEKNNLRFMLQRSMKVPMALVDQKPEHFEYRSKVDRLNGLLKQNVLDRQTKADAVIERLRTHECIPEIISNTLLDKLLITDSRGQHKDARTEMRLEVQDAEIVEEHIPPSVRKKADEAEEEEYEFDPLDMSFSR